MLRVSGLEEYNENTHNKDLLSAPYASDLFHTAVQIFQILMVGGRNVGIRWTSNLKYTF